MPSGCANIWTPRGTTLLYTTRPGVPCKVKAKKGGMQVKAKAKAKRKKKKSDEEGSESNDAAQAEAASAAAAAAESVGTNHRLQPSTILREMVARLEAEAASADKAADDKFASFDQQLGHALAKGAGLDVLRDWDEDRVKKLRFRQHVRNDLGLKFDNQAIDAFFDKLDPQGSGIVEKAEIRKAFGVALNASGGAQADADRQRTRASDLRCRAETAAAAADATEEFETKHAELSVVNKQREAVDQQAGTLIVQKWGREVTVKELGILLGKWDVRGKKEISRGEFRKGMLGLRVV